MSKSYLVVGQRYVGNGHYVTYSKVHKTGNLENLFYKLSDQKGVDVESLWEVRNGKIVKSRD